MGCGGVRGIEWSAYVLVSCVCCFIERKKPYLRGAEAQALVLAQVTHVWKVVQSHYSVCYSGYCQRSCLQCVTCGDA